MLREWLSSILNLNIKRMEVKQMVLIHSVYTINEMTMKFRVIALLNSTNIGLIQVITDGR
jgi:hypothetical protein